jgi:thiamine-phosphate pyrophosphorylase
MYLAQQIAADGVHLGLTIWCRYQRAAFWLPSKLLSNCKYIYDIEKSPNGCDYIGLGPYRFTTTKEKLESDLRVWKDTATILNEMKGSVQSSDIRRN